MRKLLVVLAVLFFVVSQAWAITTTVVLSDTTSAAQSSFFLVNRGEVVTVAFTGTVGSGETGIIQITPDDEATWISDSTLLTDTELIRVVVGPGKFRVSKSATAAAAGITITR